MTCLVLYEKKSVGIIRDIRGLGARVYYLGIKDLENKWESSLETTKLMQHHPENMCPIFVIKHIRFYLFGS
jgi:hypothetical protein